MYQQQLHDLTNIQTLKNNVMIVKYFNQRIALVECTAQRNSVCPLTGHIIYSGDVCYRSVKQYEFVDGFFTKQTYHKQYHISIIPNTTPNQTTK